ncbi:MAG: hypothetical protein PUC23_04495 [bacterium]|nr:hypothetical protein [bacterium]
MKNKKSLLGLCLLVLVLVLGVGYAVVSSVNLDITGTAKVKSSDLKVSFNGVTNVSSADKVSANATDGSLSATIAVTDLTLNESVTATYTIKNEETDVNAEVIKASIVNNKPDYFEVTTDVDSSPKTINAGGTTTVTVTVKLVQTPVADTDSTANITVNLTASPVQP